MSTARHFGSIHRSALAAILLAASVALGGCSSRDTILAEKLAAADAAAVRAEKAADRAEKAAGKLDTQPAAVVEAVAEPDGPRDPTPIDQQRQLEAASAPTNHG